MYHFNYQNEEEQFLVRRWNKQPRYGNTGYIYLIEDLLTEEFIKVGKCRDPVSRLKAYNSTRPGNTCRYICLSSIFANFKHVEQKILRQLNKDIPSLSCRREWFYRKDFRRIVEVIEAAEKYFPIVASFKEFPKYPILFNGKRVA